MGEPVFYGTAVNFEVHYCNLSFDNVFVNEISIYFRYLKTILSTYHISRGWLINGLIILVQNVINQYLISYFFNAALMDN